MSPLNRRLAGYAAYHRDRRNIATHIVGIPMIVLAVAVLVSRVAVPVGGFGLTAAMLVSAASAVFYLRLDLGFGLVMAALLALACWAGVAVAREPTAVWATTGVGLFVVGWALQFVGHYWEGRKPAFVDDIAGLIVGPLFVVAEVAVACGLRRDVGAALRG